MNHRLLFRKFSDIVFVYLLLLAIFGKSAEIIIPGGELTQDTTWNTPNTTYMIENLSDPLIIPAGKTLTIGAGVKVVSALNNKSTFIVEGTLQANDAEFELETRNGVGQPIIIEDGGQASLTACDITINASNLYSDTTAVFVLNGDADLQLSGTSIVCAETSQVTVARAIWTQDTASLTIDAHASIRSEIIGFTEAIHCASTTAAQLAGTDFADGKYGVYLDNAIVDLTVNDCSFFNYERALQVPAGKKFTFSNISIDQDQPVSNQVGVYASTYSSMTISGTISNQNIAVHVSGDHTGQDISQVTFNNCNWELLAEQDISWPGNKITTEVTLPVGHYHIENPVTIEEGGKLILLPGTIIDAQHKGYNVFNVKGSLDAEGVLFEDFPTGTDTYFINLSASGSAKVSDCQFIIAHHSNYTGNNSSVIQARDNSELTVQGCLFESKPSFSTLMQHAIKSDGHAKVTIGTLDGTSSGKRTNFVNCNWAIKHNSNIDLRISGANFNGCKYALTADTIGNLFLSNMQIFDCNSGLDIIDTGVLISDSIEFVHTLDSVSLSWGQLFNPQISTVGMSFDEDSYVVLPGKHTINGNVTMPALPYRLAGGSDKFITISAAGKLVFPPGSRVLNNSKYKTFVVDGELQASETIFKTVMSKETEHSMFFMQNDSIGRFSNCDFYGAVDAVNYRDCNILRVSGNSDVQVNGCTFIGGDSTGEHNTINIAVYINDNAKVKFASYANRVCSFANFTDTAIFSSSINNLPYVDMDSSLENCAMGLKCSLYNTASETILAADKIITTPWLHMNGGFSSRSIVIPEGRKLEFTPGCKLTISGELHGSALFQVLGSASCDGLDAEIELRTDCSFFYLQEQGSLELKNSNLTSTYAARNSTTRMCVLQDNSTLILDKSTIKTTSTDGDYKARYAIYNYSPGATILVPGAHGPSHLEGFTHGAIYSYGLEALAGEPALTFADNYSDITIRGGYELNSNLSLPAETKLDFIPSHGVTTINSSARFALGNGTLLSNQKFTTIPQATLKIEGEMIASECEFLLLGSYYDYSSNAKEEGTDVFLLTNNGNGRFTNCRFDIYSNYPANWTPRCRIFAVEGSAELLLNACFLQTRFPGKDNYPVRSAIRLLENGRLTCGSFAGVGTTFAGFIEALVLDSPATQLTIQESVFTRNDIGLLVNATPTQTNIVNNSFIGNTNYAVRNSSQNMLGCQGNYWGHPTGPLHSSNPLGLGDSIDGNVLFLPYTGFGTIEVATIEDHSAEQVPSRFSSTGNLQDTVLLRFSLGGTLTPTLVTSFIARMNSQSGFADNMLANIRLYEDINGDGELDAEDVLLGNGEFSFANKTIAFTFDESTAMDGEYLLVADVNGLKSGDAASFGLQATDFVLSSAQFLGGACSDASHYLNRLMLSAHPTGSFTNAFLAASRQNDCQLFGFRLSAGDAINNLTINLDAISGITKAKIKALRLLLDSNHNGQEDFGEEWIEAATITVAGNSGTASFIFSNGINSDCSFVLVGDFDNLEHNNTVTFAIAPDGIIAGSGATVVGSAPSVKHSVGSPLMLFDAAFQAANSLIASSLLPEVPLLTFSLTPGSRNVEGLCFELYDVNGVTAADFSNLCIFADVNQNGKVDAGETATVAGNGTAVIDVDSGTGTLTFNQSFMTAGADYILLADIANLDMDDTFTITLTRDGVAVPGHDVVEGGVSPVRHAVYRPELPEAAMQTNWTLSYRSPGGNTVTGCYSPDGSSIVLGYSSGTAFLFDADSNTPLQMFHKHFDAVQYAGFSSNNVDEETVVTVTRDGAVYVWNPETAVMENNLFADLLVRYAVPSPDASKLFIVTEGKGLLLDLTTGDTLWEFVGGSSGSTAQLNVADYSPTGEYILVGSADKNAYLLQASDGLIVRTMSPHSQQVTGANFAADGTVMLTSSTDATICLWKMELEDPIRTVSLDEGSCLGTGISQDGHRFAVITQKSGERKLHMFNDEGLQLWETTLDYKHFTGNFSSLSFSPDGQKVLLCSQANNDANLPAALAVQLSAIDGSFIDFTGPRGRVRGGSRNQFFRRVRVSEDGNRIFFMHSEGLDVIFPEFGQQIINYSGISKDQSFDITPDGCKLAYLHHNRLNSYTLRYLTVSQEERRISLLSENDFEYPLSNPLNPLTLSRSGGLTILGDSIRRTFNGSLYLNGPNTDAAYVSAFNADETSWGIAFYGDEAIKTSRLDDMSGSLEKGVTLTAPYKPVKILYHPDGQRVGCVDENAGVQFYDLDDGSPVGLYDYRSGRNLPRLHDAALSHDGTMLAVARANSVKLFDVRTGRVLRYFYPTHSGQATCQAYAVGFGARDNMLWIAWNDSYVEIFRRSRVTGLRLTPATRSLAVGRSQEYNVKALYDDGSSVDVTPSFVHRATGVELAPGARLYANPASAATIEADKVTVNPGANAVVTLEAVYTEGGYTVTASAELTVDHSSLVSLTADPAELSLVPGVLMPISYTATFSDGYQERVTSAVSLSTSTPEYLRIAGNNITVLPNAPPGELQVLGSYTVDGVTKTAQTTIFVHGVEARWNRTAVTAGGDIAAMSYSPDKQKLSVGYSSGAVAIYQVGVTPTQYELKSILPAHPRPVNSVFWRNNTELLSIGRDGRICQWSLSNDAKNYNLTAEFQHDAVITASALSTNWLVIGDNLGAVSLFDLINNEIAWSNELHSGEITTVAVNANQVMSGGEDRRLLLLNRNNGDLQMTYTSFARAPVAASFQGAQMLVLSGDKRLARWDTGTEATNILEFYFPYQPTALSLSADGSMLVATSNNGSSAVWVYNSEGLLTHWLDVPPAQGMINSLLMTPDNNHILTGRGTAKITVETEYETKEESSDFHSCQFWDRNRGSYAGSLGHSYSLNDARISTDGTMIFTQSARRIYRWDINENGVASETRFLETGYFTPYDFDNLELNPGTGENGRMLLGTRVQSSIYLMHPVERLLHMSVHTDASRFAVSPDGLRLISNSSGNLTRFWDINLDFPTVKNEHPSRTSDLAFLDNEKSLGAISEDMFVRIFNAAGEGISGINILEPGEAPSAPEHGTMGAPEIIGLQVSDNGQRVALALQYVSEDILGEITSDTFAQVYDLSGNEPARVFDTYLGSAEGMMPAVALALSNDGSLLFYGLNMAEGEGHLHDLSKGRDLRLFLSPSAGTLSCMGPAAAQFTADGTELMIAWAEGFAEVYARESLDELRLSPAERSVAAGETVDISAWICYADGSEAEVTTRTTFSITPANAGSINDEGLLTLAGNLAAGTQITVTGTYTELGTTKTGTATLRVQNPSFLSLSIDPPKISLARGQSVTARVFAHFADAMVEEVSTAADLAWTINPAAALEQIGQEFTVPAMAQYGNVEVTARLVRDGDERQVTMRVHIHHEGSMANPGDFNGDLLVDFNDLSYFIGHYGETSSSPQWDSCCDFDGNNIIDLADAANFIGLYGTDYAPTRGQKFATIAMSPTRGNPGQVTVWLEGPDKELSVGEEFELLIYAQENDPLANGFRGGPLTLLFDPEKTTYAGNFSADTALQAPYLLFQEGRLLADRIEQLCGLTVLNGYGDGKPVLYAKLKFLALQPGDLSFTLAASNTGMVLTPPTGKLTLTATDFIGLNMRFETRYEQEIDKVYDNLSAGWHLIGVPLTPRSENAWTDVDGYPLPELRFFGAAQNARTYENVAGEELKAGQAYWLWLETPGKIVLHGSVPVPDDEEGEQAMGWTMHSRIFGEQMSRGNNDYNQYFFRWNAAKACFEACNADEIKIGQGAWQYSE